MTWGYSLAITSNLTVYPGHAAWNESSTVRRMSSSTLPALKPAQGQLS